MQKNKGIGRCQESSIALLSRQATLEKDSGNSQFKLFLSTKITGTHRGYMGGQ